LTTRANAAGLEAVAADAEAAGAVVDDGSVDLTEPAAAEQLVALALERFGRLDQLVSNAGRAQKAVFGEIGAADITASVALNALPFAGLATAALPALVASDWGRVVAVSSFVANDIGINGTLFPATAAGKGALEALARNLAFQLAPTGVTVNCVAPGFTRKDGGHAALAPAAWEGRGRGDTEWPDRRARRHRGRDRVPPVPRCPAHHRADPARRRRPVAPLSATRTRRAGRRRGSGGRRRRG
jgi:3-oxoacyl-[acyl-carrier protein] reductase